MGLFISAPFSVIMIYSVESIALHKHLIRCSLGIVGLQLTALIS
jgi:hypothetical protein